jgi:hypothetical protein
MQVAEFLDQIEDKAPPTPWAEVARLEQLLGSQLPSAYRDFLLACNGGFVGGALWFNGPTPEGKPADAGVHHIGGFRTEKSYFSLEDSASVYEGRIPRDLMWIMDDPFSNAICLGFTGEHHGKVFFWDHEQEPDSASWDGGLETAGNVSLLANNFIDFVTGLQPNEEDDAKQQG